MQVLKAAGRLFAVVLTAGTAYLGAFVGVFLNGSSLQVLAWMPSMAAALVAILGMLVRWRRRAPARRVIDASLTVLLVVVLAAAGGWLSGWLTPREPESPRAAERAEGFVATRDGSIFYYQSASAGSGRPVLLVLHGGPGSGSIQLRAAVGERLGSVYRTIFFDQRGVGRSSAVSSFRIDDYVDDMERLRRALNVDSWYLLGVSWGAALADEYTLQYPARVKGVVTWGGLFVSELTTRSILKELRAFYLARGDADSAAWCGSLAQHVGPFTRLQDLRVMNAANRARLKTTLTERAQVQKILVARATAVGEWGYAESQTGTALWATVATYLENGLETYDVRPRLPQLTVPYLFLAGDRDPLMASVPLEGFASSMPRASVHRIRGSAHTIDDPEALAAEVIGFVGSVEER